MRMISSWWDDELLTTDIVVIGGGIIGTSTAIELRERAPNTRVMMLERDIVPAGASSRNAGFACVGSASEILHDIRLLGPAAALDVIERRRRGLRLLRDRCGDAAIGLEEHGAYELFLEHHPALDALDELNDLLRPLFDGTFFERRDDAILRCGFGRTRAMVHTPFEGTIHSGMMMQRLWQIAAARGVQIRTGVAVRGVDGERVEVETPAGMRTVRAERIVIATNAWDVSVAGAEQEQFVPARGQVVVTSAIADLPFRGSFHFDEGFYYFRNVGDRVLLGGARNVDVEGEQTFDMGSSPVIQQRLEAVLREVILPGRTYAIERRWSGIMGFSPDKRPHVSRIAPNIVRAFGCNGMGVAIGSAVAADAAVVTLQ
jgi:glycine/D-amino acid oxidase-like deaminating enzyme